MCQIPGQPTIEPWPLERDESHWSHLPQIRYVAHRLFRVISTWLPQSGCEYGEYARQLMPPGGLGVLTDSPR